MRLASKRFSLGGALLHNHCSFHFMIMRIANRRTFLFALSSLALLKAAKRKTLVLVDAASQEATTSVLDAIRQAGYDGFIQEAANTSPKPFAIRAALPRFEDSMDDAAKEIRKLADLAVHRGAEALIVTHPGLSGNGAFRPVDLERKARILDLGGAICARQGLQFLYQNQTLEFTGNAAEERALILRTDPKTVAFLLDAKTATDPVAFFEINQKRISAIRVSENNDALAAALKRSHWSGWLIVPFSRLEDLGADRESIRKAFSD